LQIPAGLAKWYRHQSRPAWTERFVVGADQFFEFTIAEF
jgi:hypothetical protein